MYLDLIFLCLAGGLICLLVTGISYVSYRSGQEEVVEHLNNYGLKKALKKNKEQWAFLYKYFDRFSGIGERINLLSDPEDLKDTLIKAGHPYGLTIKRANGAKVAGLLLGVIIALPYFVLGLPMNIIVLVALPFLGYLAPILLLRTLAKKRQEEISFDLPDFLDMMGITLRAGMGLDEALQYYTATANGPLGEEVERMNQEIKFGVKREAAYRSLITRTSSPELEALVQSLIQAHNLGTSVADTFVQQAEDLRRMRGEKAKESAGKAGPKITVVSSLIIAPSILILTVAVLVLNYVVSDSSPFQL